MKQELLLSGKIEMSRHEVTHALNDYLMKDRNLHVRKAIFLMGNGTINGVVLEVQQEIAKDEGIHVFPDAKVKEERENKGGFIRNNIGIFKYLRELFEDEKKKGTKKITFADVYDNVKFSFPKMTEKLLGLYLFDSRQLPKIKFKNKEVIL